MAVRTRLKKAVLGLLVAGFLLATLEGGLTFAVLVHDLSRPSMPVAERRHTQFDPELGWINKPSTRIKNMYGEGAHLTINAQGFRSAEDFSACVPPGRVRIVCSGDSFTLGYGVDDSPPGRAPSRISIPASRLSTWARAAYPSSPVFSAFFLATLS